MPSCFFTYNYITYIRYIIYNFFNILFYYQCNIIYLDSELVHLSIIYVT